ncbi:MAG: ATP-dependent Clp protease proteolytic subunit [Faecalibacterium sp.]|nr:ATP-dependent Clp protease proteolytic subunit [Ruminococcus sp.]MCM1392060.1 ATP-dependent Clp protease proteolytic subunit [Ruminococcus sp.]MCM1486663.1 ATP-dependent Clp protease proteolytic subunit [Faecalibacterium sp.]
MIPSFTKITKEGRTQTDLYSDSVNNHREIWLIGEINDEKALEIILQLRHLDRTSGDIKLFINSPGGSVTAGFAIVDAINNCKNDVSTICNGMAASMGAFILSCGTKGKRFITPLSEVMIHQPLGGAQGQASDIALVAEHILRTKSQLNKILAKNTGKPIEIIAKDCDRDFYMNSEEAILYGLADDVFTG